MEFEEDYEWGSTKILSEVKLNDLSRTNLRNHAEARGLDPGRHPKEILIEMLQEDMESERLQSIAFEESIEAEFQIQKDLEERGSVYAVGSGGCGQLGQGDMSNIETFSVVPKTQGAGICYVSTGFDLVFAVTEDHDVLVWGGGGCGPMGSSKLDKDDPQFNEYHFMDCNRQDRLVGEEVVQVSVGASHAIARSKGGDLFVWGFNKAGQLGLGNFKRHDTPEVCAGIPDGFLVCQVAAGENHSCVIAKQKESDSATRIYTWGHCADGRLGLGVRQRIGAVPGEQFFFPAPTLIDELFKETIREVACGRAHTVARSPNGVWSWGHGGGGRLGHGDQRDQYKPKCIEALKSMVVTQVCAATWHSACVVNIPPLKGYGEVYTWGSGYHGQLGQKNVQVSLVPGRVADINELHIFCKTLAIGSHHCAMIANDGELWTWGSNKHHALGREIEEDDVEYTSSPGHVGGFGAIVERTGRGMPRSVCCGKEFTIVATYPYEGPSEFVARKLVEEEEMRLEEERIRKEAEAQETLRAQRRAEKENAKKAEIERKKKQRDIELGIVEDEKVEAAYVDKPSDLVRKNAGATKKMEDRTKIPEVD